MSSQISDQNRAAGDAAAKSRDPTPAPSVIVGANGSAESYGAVRWARHVAGALGRSLTVIDACDRDDREIDSAESLQHLDDIRSRLSRHLDSHGLFVDDVCVVRGEPADVIAGCDADDPEMIVLGAHTTDGSHARRHRDLVVSLASEVRCPIVAVPPGDWFVDGRVMVGISGGEGNRAVFRWACWLAGHLGVPVVAVHVIDPMFKLFATDDCLSAEEIAVRHEVERTDAEFVELVAADTNRSLVEYAQIRSASLLVVGARVRHSMGGRLIGGVAHGVIENCTCPVAVVPRSFQLDHE